MADFGLAGTIRDVRQQHLTVENISGTPGYACPVYIRTGHVNEQTEAYSFGVVLLELLLNMPPALQGPSGDIVYPLLQAVMPGAPDATGRVLESLDRRAAWPRPAAEHFASMALSCIDGAPERRPPFEQLVRELRALAASASAAAASAGDGAQGRSRSKTPPAPEDAAQASEVALSCVHADGVDLAALPAAQRCLAFPAPAARGAWSAAVGRQHQPELFDRLVLNKVCGAQVARAGVPKVSSVPAVAAAAALAAARARRRDRRGERRGGACQPVALRATAVAEKSEATVGEVLEREDIRNIAIIAHVDHGKTTLTNALMKQTSNDDSIGSMDSNQIESERGITILAKNASVEWKGVKINIIDTPGHADFGGEVERILNMADACLLLVDAQEGPMPQTKFVLKQALKLGRKVIVVINKVDKPAARCDWVLDTTFDLFASLGADDELCDFPVCYASGFLGVASRDGPDSLEKDLSPILDQILEECPKPMVDTRAPLQMLISNLDFDPFIGRIAIGRIRSGNLKVGQELGFQFGPKGAVRKAKISKLWDFCNNQRREVDVVKAGDICAFSGMDDVTIGDTVVDPANPQALPPIVVEEPTVVMEFGVNMSPFSGQLKETKWVTSSHIKNRLEKETMTNLAMRVEQGSTAESFRVKARGILQLGILIENLRREGFEVMIGPPEVITLTDPETGEKLEPYEDVVVDTPTEYQGTVMEEMQKKSAELVNMEAGAGEGSMIMSFKIPTRNLIGMQGVLMRRTKGQAAVLNSRFAEYGPYQGDGLKFREAGSVVSASAGKVTAYQLVKMKSRATFWVKPAEELYEGMICGIHNKEEDITINMAKSKGTSNVREKTATGVEAPPPPLPMSIDDFLGHMDTDEMLEVTPGPIRLLKRNSKALKVR
ncbi:unnamed protein product [Prorocentrum cordatum]|nr:unnamed protein product [Polarella glacialis]